MAVAMLSWSVEGARVIFDGRIQRDRLPGRDWAFLAEFGPPRTVGGDMLRDWLWRPLPENIALTRSDQFRLLVRDDRLSARGATRSRRRRRADALGSRVERQTPTKAITRAQSLREWSMAIVARTCCACLTKRGARPMRRRLTVSGLERGRRADLRRSPARIIRPLPNTSPPISEFPELAI